MKDIKTRIKVTTTTYEESGRVCTIMYTPQYYKEGLFNYGWVDIDVREELNKHSSNDYNYCKLVLKVKWDMGGDLLKKKGIIVNKEWAEDFLVWWKDKMTEQKPKERSILKTEVSYYNINEEGLSE